MKGYIHHDMQLMVLKNDSNYGFLKISEVKPLMAENDDIERFGDY